MKTFTITLGRLFALVTLLLVNTNLFAQGFRVYTIDGQHQEYAAENVDSIVFFTKPTDDYQSSGTLNGHEWIDLGLPSGLKWATCNVGASSPERYGNYYAWGEKTPKSIYYEGNSTTYGLSTSDLQFWAIIGSDGNLTYGYDAATAWGSEWRMPTHDEMKELIDNCTWTWTTQNSVGGYKVTGSNGNSIFLPAAGYMGNTDLYDAGYAGFYWSATPHSNYSGGAYDLYFNSNYGYGWSCPTRVYGRSVRPVTD